MTVPKMKNPKGRVVSVSDAGVEALRARGYSLLGEAVRTASSAEGFDVDSATKKQLVEYAERHDIEITKSATVDEVRDQVRATL